MDFPITGRDDLITPVQLQLKVIFLVGIWLEGLLYGVYLFLFISALTVLLRKDGLKTFSAKVFLGGSILMFFLISIHNGINAYRMVIAYACQIDILAPVELLYDVSSWDAYAGPVLMALVLWIGDILVIYRCFLICRRSYVVIALPLLLLMTSIGTHSVNLWWFRHPSEMPYHQIVPFLHITFPLHFVQNVLTTGLITYRIWAQYRDSKAAGLVHINALNLVSVMRIMVESAAIYTVEMLCAVILHAIGHPLRFLAHYYLVPTTGIVFLLMAIRMHALRMKGADVPTSASLMPSWLLGGPIHDNQNTSGAG